MDDGEPIFLHESVLRIFLVQVLAQLLRLFQITYSGTHEGSQDLHVFAVTNLLGARKVGPGPQNKTSLRFANRGFCQATGSSFLVSLMYPQVHSRPRKIPSLLEMSVIS